MPTQGATGGHRAMLVRCLMAAHIRGFLWKQNNKAFRRFLHKNRSYALPYILFLLLILLFSWVVHYSVCFIPMPLWQGEMCHDDPRGGIRSEQQVWIILLPAATKVVLHSDDFAPLQLFNGPPHRATGDPAGFWDSLSAWVAAVFSVVALEQVAVNIKFNRWQLLIKDFVLHDEEVSLAHSSPPFYNTLSGKRKRPTCQMLSKHKQRYVVFRTARFCLTSDM